MQGLVAVGWARWGLGERPPAAELVEYHSTYPWWRHVGGQHEWLLGHIATTAVAVVAGAAVMLDCADMRAGGGRGWQRLLAEAVGG